LNENRIILLLRTVISGKCCSQHKAQFRLIIQFHACLNDIFMLVQSH